MSHETTYETLQTELADGVMTVTLDRPTSSMPSTRR